MADTEILGRATVEFRAVAVGQDTGDDGTIPEDTPLEGIRVRLTPSPRKIEVAAGGIDGVLPAKPTTFTLREWELVTDAEGYLLNPAAVVTTTEYPHGTPESLAAARTIEIVASDAIDGVSVQWTSVVDAPDSGVPAIAKVWLAPAGSIVDLTTVESIPPSPGSLAEYLQAVRDARSARDIAVASGAVASAAAERAEADAARAEQAAQEATAPAQEMVGLAVANAVPPAVAQAVEATLPAIDPVTFGADPTGIAESSAAFQQAFDRVLAAPTHPVTVKPSPGVYTLRNVRIRANTTLDLTGVTLVYGGTNGTTGPVEYVPTVLWSGQAAGEREEGIVIRGGTLVGGRLAGDFTNISGPTSDDTIYLWRASAPQVIGVTIRNAGQDSLTLDDCPGAHVDGCTFKDGGDAAIDLRAGAGYTITSSTFERVRDAVAAKPNINNVTVRGCSASTFGAAIIAHGQGWTVEDNTITTATTQDGLSGVSVAAIRVFADGAIAPLDTYDITIRGNTIIGRTSAAAVELPNVGAEALSRVTVNENHIRECNRGVLVQKGSDVSVRNNNISTTARTVWVAAGSRVAIIGNTLTSATNRCVDTSRPDTIIKDNRVTASASDALYLSSAATGSSVTGNHITSAGIGVTSWPVGGQVSGNIITTSAGAGVLLAGASCIAVGNRIAATNEGVHVTGAGSSVVGNIITGGSHGVRLAASDAVVTGNRCTGAAYFGVNIMAGSVDCVVVGNMLKGNTTAGVQDAGTTSTVANNKP